MREKDLFDSIKKISEDGEKIDIEKVRKFVKRVNEKMIKNIEKNEFLDLVELVREVAISHELPYRYCKVAYLYYGKKRKKL